MYLYLIISESEHLFIVFKCSLHIFVSIHDFFPIFLVGFGPLPLNFYHLPFSLLYIYVYMGFPGGKLIKNPPANAEDKTDGGLVPGSGRSPGVGYSNSLQYFCLENTMDRGDWQATVHEVAKNRI